MGHSTGQCSEHTVTGEPARAVLQLPPPSLPLPCTHMTGKFSSISLTTVLLGDLAVRAEPGLAAGHARGSMDRALIIAVRHGWLPGDTWREGKDGGFLSLGPLVATRCKRIMTLETDILLSVLTLLPRGVIDPSVFFF